uniref:protocadherin-10-like n=1 Tax=Pristiophorus japonicus TaxID=55135 RepID=UPI00398F80CE
MAFLLNFRLSPCHVLYLILVYLTVSVCQNIRYTIPEELELRAFVGNIATDLGLDVNTLLARRFRIESLNKKQYCDVNLKTGILFIKETIDREELCEQSLTCLLKLEAVIENPLNQHRLEIEILDLNDNSPVFQSSELNIEIKEFMAPGTSFRLQSARDPDAGTNSIRSYQLRPNEHFTLKTQPDSVQTGIPELVLERRLDREQQPIHRLTLTAFDGGNPEKFGTAQIIITVLDVNDNAPVCEQNVYQITTAENVPKGTVIVKVTAVDEDEGQNGDVIYSFSDHTPDKVREVFSIDSASGEIRVTGIVDFEEAENYQISVQASDRGPHPLSVHCKVLLKVTDVNDNCPVITITSTSSSITEGAVTDTAVALLRVTDPDSEHRADVYCRIPRDIPFKLNASFNNYYTLLIHGELDREKVPEYNITILCTDAGSPPLSTKQTIRVQVSDINDNVPRFTQPSVSIHVMENNVIGASIGSVSAFDPDSNQNGQMSFDILDRLIHGLPAATLVSINSASGIMSAQISFDFEQLKTFQMCVQVKDAGSPPLSSNVTVNVIIVDQNDNVPVIVSPLSNKGAAAEDTIPRSADSGYLLTKVTATDADSGQNAELSYKLRQPTDESLFTVAPETGEIWTIRRFRSNDSVRQKIVILVRDNGTPSLSSTITINISVQYDTTENGSNIGMFETIGPWNYDLKCYLLIAFGSTSFLLLVAIVILGTKLHRGTNEFNSYCCCWNTSYFSTRDSLHGIQKASVNLQIPPNYTEVYESGTFPQPFRYDVCQDASMNHFAFLKLQSAAAPLINIKTGSCVAPEHGKASNSKRKDTTAFHEDIISKISDDTNLGSVVNSEENSNRLQEDIDRLVELEATWQMNFNAENCELIHCGKHSDSTGRVFERDGGEVKINVIAYGRTEFIVFDDVARGYHVAKEAEMGNEEILGSPDVTV